MIWFNQVPYDKDILSLLADQGGNHMMSAFRQMEGGQGLVEYALILVMVAIVVIISLALLGPGVGNMFSTIVGGI